MFRKSILTVGLLALAQIAHADIDISQVPLFVSESVPPLNMLVMGKDHKLYYEAYNDASDLNGDGVIDVGYKGHLSKANGGIDYYGYFNSYVCYTYDGDKFTPASATTTKRCTNQWSGDFLNYIATSRMDALRKVLYGGRRATDSATATVLQGAYIPQDAHTWGKEYMSQAHDGYLISSYTPLAQPASGYRHLFAVTSLSDNAIPQLRTLNNTSLRIWNWVSKERPVAGTSCINASGAGVSCTSQGPNNTWALVPANVLSNMQITIWKDNLATAANATSMDTLFNATNSSATNRCGTGAFGNTTISTVIDFVNPWTGAGNNACTQNYYHTLVTATLTPALTGTYTFSVDGDDAVEFALDGNIVATRYGNNGASVANGQGGVGVTGNVYLTAGQTYSVRFRHEENDGSSAFYLFWKTPENGPSTMTDRNIRVAVCTDTAAVRDENCVAYGEHYKPTGILHDYGASDKMYFGLLSGSFQNNMTGGVLRSQLQSFTKEYKGSTGQFCFSTDANCDTGSVSNGIVSTIDKFRIIDFNYSNQQYGCGWITTSAMGQNNHCYMWGNPIAEMMYETMRYFSGATDPTSTYDYGSGASKDADLGLPRIAEWTPPYRSATQSSGYAACAVPVMTVISDINPSYDSKLPGSHWDTSVTASPTALRGLNVSTEADKVWAKEGGGTKSIFIGESAGNSDSAPTVKSVTNLSTVRGLSPEEPSKQGTYYAAAIANFGANNKIGGDKNLLTYSVALASPLPTIKFPVGGNTVTVVPFAKSVSGSSINPAAAFQPTDQIVDYYVEKIANTDASCSTTAPSTVKDCDSTTNGGRPYAKFRINYEDVEQGADHDMDAIAIYELMVNTNSTLTINMTSEYAAGDINQHMGYVISGTTKDGIYLEVKDQGGANVAYKLDTPDTMWAGDCGTTPCAALSRLSSTRTFSTSTTASANFLPNPLWYAAKYGSNSNTMDANGDPDNYFLVTNALTLKAQLTKAFSDIDQKNNSVNKPSVDTVRENSTTDSAYVYRTNFEVDGWTGDVYKEKNTLVTSIDADTGERVTSTARVSVWKAASNMPSNRTILMADSAATSGDRMMDLTWTNLLDKTYNGLNLQATLNRDKSGVTDTYGEARLAFVRGEACTSLAGCSTLRTRQSKLGDIINSAPVLVSGARYLAYRAGSVDGGTAKYAEFQVAAKARTPMLYVGANDGMLHAFDANTGIEQFAFVPTAVIPNLYKLSASDYGTDEGTPHQSYVDGSITSTDVYYDDEWHTVLIGTLGAGGREVFALDVTDPTEPKLLWEFTQVNDGDLGFTVPKVTIARLHTGEWAALVPNGYNSASNGTGQATLFALNVQTGAVIKKMSGTATAKNSESTSNWSNGLSSLRAADINGDGITDYAYAGDMLGNMWRFDLLDTSATTPFTATATANKLKTSFNGEPLYTALDSSNNRQPITAAPSLVRHPVGPGYLVAFGTGRYLGSTDKSSMAEQSTYGIWDRQTSGEAASSSGTTNKTRTNLQQQELSTESVTVEGLARKVRFLTQNAVNWYLSSATGRTDSDVDRWGWYFDLKATSTADGERAVYDPYLYGDALIVSTIAPNSDVCAAGLTGLLYGLNPYTGGALSYTIFDLNGDGTVNAADQLDGTSPSGIDLPNAGDTSVGGGDDIFGTGGDNIGASRGTVSTGRQTWREIPANEEEDEDE